MENFIDISKVPCLFKIKDDLVDLTTKDLSHFLEKMPIEQNIKYNKILNTSFIKMYSIPIKYGEDIDCPCKGDMNEIFNFTVDNPEYNYNLGNGPMAEQIKKIMGNLHKNYNLNFFNNLLSIIPKWLAVGWIFFYKKGALVNEDEGHGHTTILVHFLLDDIEDGDFVVNVNNEEKKLNKRGDYFIFNGILPHGAYLTGDKATFLTFAMNEEDLFKV